MGSRVGKPDGITKEKVGVALPREYRSRMRLLLFILLVGMGRGAVDVTLSEGGLYKPTFLLDDRSFAAGTAFLTRVSVSHQQRTILVSCFHVMGDTPQDIRSVAALAMTAPQQAIVAARIVPVKGARSADDLDMAGELSLFLVKDLPKQTKVLQLAAVMPKVGEAVWLYARLFQTAVPKFYRGRVVSETSAHLIYVMDDPELELGGTSGAPILNAKGEVVGINAGGRKFVGTLHGFANPVSVFRPKMLEALAALSD